MGWRSVGWGSEEGYGQGRNGAKGPERRKQERKVVGFQSGLEDVCFNGATIKTVSIINNTSDAQANQQR